MYLGLNPKSLKPELSHFPTSTPGKPALWTPSQRPEQWGLVIGHIDSLLSIKGQTHLRMESFCIGSQFLKPSLYDK